MRNADVVRLVLAIAVITSVATVHAQDRTAEYKAEVAFLEYFNEIQREAGMPEFSIPTYEEWIGTALETGTATETAVPSALLAFSQSGSPPPAAPLSGGLTALELYQIWATHCGNSTNAATTDDDGDGVSNLDEVLAGTDPDDEYDFFVIDFSEVQGTNAVVSYLSEALRDYELQTSTNLLIDNWTVVGTATGTGQIVTHSIPLEEFQHYRANIAGALDSDDDGVPDWLERCVGTNPLLADTDDDGTTDDQELLNGTPANDGMHVNGHLGQFRVWAPNASTAQVFGTFNSWSGGIGLTPLGNGYWSGSVAGVTNGTEYKFVLNGSNWMRDPTSRKLGAGSDPNSVYYNPYEFSWTDEEFVRRLSTTW